MSIFRGIFKKHNISDDSDCLKNIVEEDFYIPDATVLQKVNDRQPLNKPEINQYLNYIYLNYYLPQNSEDAICIFGGDFSKYDGNLKALKEREENAKIMLAHQLASGEAIDTTYALWFSRNIYVDNENECFKRVIRKDINGGYDVYTASKYYSVGRAVDSLHRELNSRMLSKDVANNL